jgi:hypothetical protein
VVGDCFSVGPFTLHYLQGLIQLILLVAPGGAANGYKNPAIARSAPSVPTQPPAKGPGSSGDSDQSAEEELADPAGDMAPTEDCDTAGIKEESGEDEPVIPTALDKGKSRGVSIASWAELIKYLLHPAARSPSWVSTPAASDSGLDSDSVT